jgi:Domain of unknown function (DUF4926)
MKQYTRVKLANAAYESENVKVGSVGYIIEIHADGKYEVEFSNPDTGETLELLVLSDSDCISDE